jgi:hypothetical protein
VSDAQVLKAGGLVPADAKLGKEEAVDTVVARGYQHPVLPGRTIVRLTALSVVAGDDLEMTTLGFGAGEDRGAVGKERKRPLGFPGWALVHDPKNARYALDVVKEFKKHARKAKSKPGHAKEGIDAIAKTLGKTVPHFLPSFFEEAGRAFIEHGSQSYAAAMFGKAREAEAVHALDVDEQHRVVAFLEFALAGAVTTKALSEYAKELGEHHEPKVAYAHFRQLCLQRTLGGMPPWAGMAKDLRRLAKAAKLDPDAEDAKLVEEIIESPALAKAAGEFWRAYAAPITVLAKAKPAARAAVLNLFPTGTTYNADLDDAWLDLLDSTGAVNGLVGDDPECQPSGSRAAWFDKLTQHLARSWRNTKVSDRAFVLLRRMAPKLVADGKSIACVTRWHQVDLDLAELALELGIAVAPPDGARIDVNEWAQRAAEAEHGRDPVRAAAHARLGPMLGESVAQQIGNEPFDSMSRGKTGFLVAKRGWLAEVLSRAERAGLPGLQDALDLVKTKVKAETFAELPELHARFAALDPARALARTLRVGLVDELGWPALEAAAAELNSDGKTALTIHGGLPAVIVATATRAIAVGPAGRLGVHDFVLPPKTELVTARFVGGQFLVAIKDGWKVRCYWSGTPQDLFDTEASHWHVPTFANRCTVLADGAWQEGAKPIRVGDRVAPGGNLSSHDGTTAWVSEWKEGRHLLREVSPTGEQGRASWPAFLEAGIEPDWHIDGTLSYVLPVPAGITSSPLGMRDGLVGVRIRYKGENQHSQTARDLVTIDGRTWTGPVDVKADELLTLPSGEPRPIVEDTQWRVGTTATILDSEGAVRGSKIGAQQPLYWRGSIAPYSTSMWHVLTPRDVAGSKRLRAISDADARALMGALVNGELSGLPEVTHTRLRQGVAGVVELAVQCEKLRDELRTERAPGKATAKSTGAATIDDEVLLAALGGWCDRRYGTGSALAQLARVGAFFRDADRSDRSVTEDLGSRCNWPWLALVPNALAFLAVTIGAADRKTILALLDAIARELPDPAKLRVVTANTPDDDAELKHPLVLRWRAGNAYAVLKHGWGNAYQILEYAPDGTFKALAPFHYTNEQRGRAAITSDDLAAVTAAVAAGTTSWRNEVADKLAAATGLTPSEAAFLWAGCPNANNHSVSFLAKELREQLGLKATQAALARDLLNAVPLAKRLAVIDQVGAGALAPDGADKLAAAWVRVVGKRIAIPEELITDADREIQAPFPPGVALAMIGNAKDAPRLTTDGAWALDKEGDLIPTGSAAPLVGQAKQEGDRQDFDTNTMATACAYLPFLYAELPVGDPLRAQAPVAYELVLARLKNPALYFAVANHQAEAGFESLLASLGGDDIAGLDAGYAGRVVRGGIVVTQTWTAGTPPTEYLRWKLQVHPATYDGKAAATLGALAEQAYSWGYAPQKCLALLRSDDLAAMMKRIGDTPVPVGGWEQNPLASVPKLVDKAAKHLGVSKDAAALYLQYLVLLWPIAKNLVAWNGWKPKQLEAAQTELENAELILEAKRERAGRTYFLPGGWEALKSPHPPFETWKLPMYGTRATGGTVSPTMMRYVANAPFHLLFERAWKRIENGDVPKYDEVKR